MSKTTNPTARKFAGLQAEVKVAKRVCSKARGTKEEEAAGQRVAAASEAILSARPTDPSVMAAQLRFLVAKSVVDADARGALQHIAEQLEAMAGSIVLSADAAAQIRAALLAVLNTPVAGWSRKTSRIYRRGSGSTPRSRSVNCAPRMSYST